MLFEIMLESYKDNIFTSIRLQEDFFEEMLEEAVDEVDIEAKVMISLKIDYILLLFYNLIRLFLISISSIMPINILINKYFFEILNV